MKRYDVPILILAWNRADSVSRVIKAISQIKPRSIYFSCDGPRKTVPNEEEKVKQTIDTVKREIYWDCKLTSNLNDENLGCANAVSSAITWFFNQVDYGIIIEDDCIPHVDYFEYAEILLDKYKQDQRIWCIGAVNLQKGRLIGDGSYYLSVYNHCWCWATWKSRWSNYDHKMTKWNAFLKNKHLDSIFISKRESRFWQKYINKMIREGKPDSWAMRWYLSCLMNGGLTILPNKNLVSNIGFGINATNTKTGQSPVHLIETKYSSSGLLPIKHPSFLIRSVEADLFTFKTHFSKSIMWRIQKKIIDVFKEFIK